MSNGEAARIEMSGSVASPSAMPGLRGVEHIAFTVPDLDEAVDFFVDVLGCEYMYPIGPFRDAEGDWFKVNLDLHPRAEIPAACLLRCGHGSNLEIFEYRAPDQRREMPRMSDWGGVHIALYVDDMDAGLAHLASKGVRILGGKKDGLGVESGEGSSFAHFLSPWGMLLELVSFPHGKAYMTGRERLLWQPTRPAL
jgi:catechol 2,3-dioxygenase-like lactoylglutathione lyase family enzyme